MSEEHDALGAALERSIATYRAGESVPGLALAVTDANGLIAQRAVGFADVAARASVTPETLFEIGSIGKAFTAVAILQLQQEGRLRVGDAVVRHLPWFRVPRHTHALTIHHLLSHTAGITAGIDGTPEAVFQVWRLRDLRPGSAPGRRFHYSNVGYKALGLLIEAVEGESYPAVLQRRILTPLGMRSTVPAITHAARPHLAVGYEPARDDVPWADGEPLAPATWLETGTADGSVAATAADLATFVRGLMSDDSGIAAQMGTPVPALHGFGYGYALIVRTLAGRRYIGHGGGMVGYRAGMQWDADAGIGAVVLQNGPGNNPNALARLAIRQARAAQAGVDPSSPALEDADDSIRIERLAGDADASPARTEPTGEQAVITGSYRSHNPWTTFFRVEARGSELWLVFPAAPDGFDDEQPLVPTRGPTSFRVGADPLGPELLHFDTQIDGRARRAWLSGWDYYRADD